MKLSWETSNETKTETKTHNGLQSHTDTQTRKKGREMDFIGLATIIVLAVIAYEMLAKTPIIPFFIWELIAILLVIEIAAKIVGGIIAVSMFKKGIFNG